MLAIPRSLLPKAPELITFAFQPLNKRAMIPDQWYVILDSRELKRGRMLHVKRMGEDLCLWRDEQGTACCIEDKCCHRGASLSCGRLRNGKVECPFHGFVYNSDGRVSMIPAIGKNAPVPQNMRVKAYRTYETGGLIWLWWGEAGRMTEKPFFFEELKDFSYSTFKDHWKVHYSRAVENQLDVMHLPFVHRTTIGRGNKTLVNGPVVVREDELITFYVDNVADDGQTTPLKPEEIQDYEKLFHLRFHFPNIWQNYISDRIRVFAAFVPVDEEQCVVYVRYYQRMLKVPGLKQLFNFIGKITNRIILRQDKRVVITQIPVKTELRMNENLVTGDRPIVEYRKYRQFLKNRPAGGE
jgi:phenylpropionate dioxygenase-like ring-hydroxylating dioxygenase large terminal subunit